MTAYAGLADVHIVTNAGAPTDGTSGTGAGIANPGSLCVDTTNCALYQNTNTAASPSWTSISAGAATNLDLGSSGTAGSLDVFPTTASKGKLSVTATDNGGNHTVAITNAEHGQASTYTIPDVGGAAGQFAMVTAAYAVLIDPNSAARAVSLSGDVTFGGAVTLAGALTTAAAVTFSGAYAATIAVPSASTWTLPSGGGTLATTTGAETGTTSATFTVDSDSAAAKIALDTNSATGDYTASLVPANLTANRTISFADASGTVMVLDNGSSQTAGGDFVFTGTLDFQGNMSASTGDPDFDLSSSSGAFQTTTGTNTINGNVVGVADVTFDWSASSGTFKTSTGTNTLNGNVVVAGSKTFDTGTGAVGINGDTTIAADKDVSCASGTTAVDFSDGSGTFKTSTGANTLSGDVTISGSKTFTTGTGAITVKGATTFDAGLDIAFSGAGDGTLDMSTQTGIFKTSTGDNTLGGDTYIAANKDLVLTAGTGYIQANGQTNGALKFAPIASGTGTTTVQNSATAGATITLPATTCTLPGIGLSNTFSAAQAVTIDDATNDAVTDLVTLTHTTSGTATAGIGVGMSFCIEDLGGAEEQASFDVSLATVTDGAEDADLVWKTQLNGDVCQVFKIDSVNQTAVIGQNASDADGVYQLTIYPVTAARGSLILAATANTGDTTLTVTNVAQGGANTAQIPNIGAGVTDQFVLEDVTQTLTNKTIAGDANTLSAIARASLAEEALASYGIPFGLLRNDNGTIVDATGGAGLFAITNGGIGSGTQTLDGEAASGNSKTDVVQFEFTLPPEYVAAGDVKVVITARESVGAATVATTLSGEAYEDDTEGGVSANLLASWDATDITAAWATFTGTITATNLVAGDKVRVYLQIVTNDTGATVGTVAQIGTISMQCDIKG